MIVTILSAVGAFMLKSKYESSTTILVQREEILNPLIRFEMAITAASEDRLRTFNEIIYSNTTIQKLIDSLRFSSAATTNEKGEELVKTVRRNVTTERRGSDSFRISYLDTDPVRAQKAASLLANLFITTILRVAQQRDDQAVQFFENKLEELHQKFEASQKQVVNLLQQRMNTMPVESRGMYNRLEEVEKQISDIDSRANIYNQALDILKTLPTALQTESGKQRLYDLARYDIPLTVDLRPLLIKYDDYLRRYTPKYPEVEKLEKQIEELLDQVRSGVQSEFPKLEPKRSALEQRRTALIDNIRESSVNERVGDEKESDYGMYRKLYDDMKVKLEQAKTSRDLGSTGANQFIIIDPALVPFQASKPNKRMIVLGGFGLGIFLGLLVAILRELLDTTIRAPRDIEQYNKPVIAFITSGQKERLT